MFFLGLFGLPLLTGFIVISGGASETAGSAVMVATFIAVACIGYWHEGGVKQDRRKQWHADMKRAADKFGWESRQVDEIRQFERAYLHSLVETNEASSEPLEGDPLNAILDEDLDRLIEAEEKAADRQSRQFSWEELYTYQLPRYFIDHPNLKIAYEIYKSQFREAAPTVAARFLERRTTRLRYLRAFNDLLIREQRLWAKLIDKPGFATAYASHRNGAEVRYPDAAAWYKEYSARHFGDTAMLIHHHHDLED